MRHILLALTLAAVTPLLAQPAGAVRGGEAAADEQVVDLAVGHGGTLYRLGFPAGG